MRVNTEVNITLDSLHKSTRIEARTREQRNESVAQNRLAGRTVIQDLLATFLGVGEKFIHIISETVKLGSFDLLTK